MINKRIKVVYVVQAFPVLSETFIFNQIADIIDRGYDVTIHASSRQNSVRHKLIDDYSLLEKTVFRSELPYTRRGLIKAIFSLMGSSWKASFNIIKYLFKTKILKTLPFDKKLFIIGNEIRKTKADIIHVHFGFNGIEIAKLKQWGIFRDVKMITTFHGYDIHKEALFDGLYTTLFEQCDIFTVNSEYSKKNAAELGCPLQKTVKLPVGLNISNFTPSNTDTTNESLKIVFVGRLIELKAPDLVIEICYLLHKRAIDFTCKIIGYGDMFDRLVQMIADYDLAGKIELLGAQTQEQIIEIMDQSNVFLFPGIYSKSGRAEAQGLVIQEAQAMQLPVLVSDAGGMSEGMIDGKTGFVIAERDLTGFADKLEYWANNRDIRIQMGKDARKYAIENFSINHLGDKLDAIYHN